MSERTKTRKVAARAARSAKQQMVAAVEAEVRAQDHARNMQQYVAIGRVLTVETAAGPLHFERQRGPAIATEFDAAGEQTGRLLFLGAWDGRLPEVKEYSEDFCPACLVVCDVCNGRTTGLCTLTGCGGRGKQKTGETFCQCVVASARVNPECIACHGKGPQPCNSCINSTGTADPKCATCGGYGAVAEYRQCPACKGTGTATCAACRGTGKRPSGYQPYPAKEKCGSCRGTLRAGNWKPQDVAPLVIGAIGKYMAFGPVLRLVLEPIENGSARFTGAARPNAFIRLTRQTAADGTPWMVLLPMSSAVNSAIPYFYGGSEG